MKLMTFEDLTVGQKFWLAAIQVGEHDTCLVKTGINTYEFDMKCGDWYGVMLKKEWVWIAEQY